MIENREATINENRATINENREGIINENDRSSCSNY